MGLIVDRIRTGASKVLAPGRYWIDLFPSPAQQEALKCDFDCRRQSLALGPVYYQACKLACGDVDELGPSGNDIFNDWGQRNGTSVKVITTQQFKGTEPSAVGIPFSPPRTWVLFEAVKPVVWDIADKIGNANPATPDIQQSDDTVQKPPPEAPIIDLERGDVAWIPLAVGGTIVVVGLVALAKLVRG